MKGLQIFTHSVRQVVGNFNAALRVSGVLFLVQVALVVVLGLSVLMDQAAMQQMIQAGTFPWGRALLMVLVVLACNLWIAVGWHRYVLKMEQPGVVPPLHADLMLAYFGKSLLIGLILIPVAAVLGLVVGLIMTPMLGGPGGPSGLAFIIFGLIVYVPLVLIGYRLSVVLPGTALGEPLGFAAAWNKTRGATAAILTLAVVSVVASLIIDLPAFYVFAPDSILSAIWQAATYWLKMMVGISILTTLYGHYVEGRALI